MTPPPPIENEKATLADMELRQFEQIALARQAVAENRATPEQIAFLENLHRI